MRTGQPRHCISAGQRLYLREEQDVQVDVDLLGQLGGGSPEGIRGLLAQLRIQPRTDWAGRAVVSAGDARRTVEHYRRVQEEHARLVSEYDWYLRDRTRRLMEAGDAAYRETAERELKKQYETPWAGGDGRGYASGGVTYTHQLSLWPRGRQMAREAALQARAKFERENPQLDFEAWARRR